MGKRNRQRERLRAPESEYADAEGNVLVLRGAMTPATRTQYAEVRSGLGDAPGAAREDAWHRAVEFLFERLAVRWTIAGAPAISKQKELLARFRFASDAERTWIRTVMREHVEATFPDLEAP